ncbi:AAA family ATPase [Anaerostipes sp.]|uniref:AAA family ATPase n=1 Tax=Anaerostipes sp. TaxID=1872530 RepID=UPI0039918419
MGGRFVRIENITIENFKNVKYGTLDLTNRKKNYRASIVGVYGQNGSGKTALVDALQVLKFALCGKAIPEKYADYVHVDEDHATLKFQFKMQRDEVSYDIWYQFSLKKMIDDTHSNEEGVNADLEYKTQIYDEVLSFAYTSKDEKVRKGPLVDTRTSGVFVPKSKFNELLGEVTNDITELLVTKRLVQTQGRTFVFSREMINAFRKNCKNEKCMSLIEGLYTFGNRELFVIDTENSGLISMNALPLAFKYKEKNSETVGNLMLPLNVAAPIPEDAMELVKKIISNMNIVLEEIIPGLTIDIVDLGPMVSKDGKIGRLIQLMSLKNNKAIPFQYESEGIKKIVSILQLLIVVYNNPSITVAIDEMDAGIFEYLLGELLNIISERGKGQLIFTSHNLRPLETIDKGFIAFTTTNPDNRYIRMTNVKGNNNLRDFYYRDIVLGEQNEPVYNPTNNYEIALAFREAGEVFGS